MYINLSGLHVLLTGATHSIGKSIALKLAESGATLALQYHSKAAAAEELAMTLGNGSRAFKADFHDSTQLRKFADDLFLEYKDIEVLINNTSQYIPNPLTAPSKEWCDGWKKNFKFNFDAPAYLCKRAVDHWRKKRSSGRIINISVLPPTITSSGEELAYKTAKSALEAFTKNLSQAVFSSKVKTFTLILPPLRNEQHLRFSGKNSPEEASLAKPRDIAPIVVFLCSGLADHTSGTVINASHAQLQLSRVLSPNVDPT